MSSLVFLPFLEACLAGRHLFLQAPSLQRENLCGSVPQGIYTLLIPAFVIVLTAVKSLPMAKENAQTLSLQSLEVTHSHFENTLIYKAGHFQCFSVCKSSISCMISLCICSNCATEQTQLEQDFNFRLNRFNFSEGKWPTASKGDDEQVPCGPVQQNLSWYKCSEQAPAMAFEPANLPSQPSDQLYDYRQVTN